MRVLEVMVVLELHVVGRRPHCLWSRMTQRLQMRPYTTVMEIDEGAGRVFTTRVGDGDSLIEYRKGPNESPAGGGNRVGNSLSRRRRRIVRGFGQLEIGIGRASG